MKAAVRLAVFDMATGSHSPSEIQDRVATITGNAFAVNKPHNLRMKSGDYIYIWQAAQIQVQN